MDVKTIALASLFILAGCGEKKAEPVARKFDTLYLATQIVVRHDTLVYMVTTDSIKFEQKNYSFMVVGGGGWECCYPVDGDRFKNGRTKDTIYKHEIIYY